MARPCPAPGARDRDAFADPGRDCRARYRPRTVYRQQGDRNILVEYGPITLDIELRIRVHALMTELERMACPA
jgi:hypothetical protein